jgi:hypothetical protein
MFRNNAQAWARRAEPPPSGPPSQGYGRPEMTRVGAYEIPSWAIAILFWRKVDQVEGRGIPGIRASQNDHDGVVENGVGRAGG